MKPTEVAIKHEVQLGDKSSCASSRFLDWLSAIIVNYRLPQKLKPSKGVFKTLKVSETLKITWVSE